MISHIWIIFTMYLYLHNCHVINNIKSNTDSPKLNGCMLYINIILFPARTELQVQSHYVSKGIPMRGGLALTKSSREISNVYRLWLTIMLCMVYPSQIYVRK